jgi:hypothetical protein
MIQYLQNKYKQLNQGWEMDDTQPQETKPISDDQELAKVLAGVSKDADNLQYEETPKIIPDSQPDTDPNPTVIRTPPVPPVESYVTPTMVTPAPADTGDLEDIKKNALTELRPLVDKLELAPEEKFDTYLLLIRSTDDKTLIGPAHAAARAIPDETRRAQALLDIIKEIDFLSNPQ